MCEICKKESEKRSQHGEDTTQSFAGHRKTTQYGNNASSSNFTTNANLEKDTILPVDYYAKTFFETVKQKYLDMLEQYSMNKDSIISKQNYFRIESQIMMTRI